MRRRLLRWCRRSWLEVVALHVIVQAARVPERSCSLGTRSTASAPAESRRAQRQDRRPEADRRHEPGRLLLRVREHLVAELGDERGLDLVLRAALVDEPLDERPLALGRRRVLRNVQRNSALQAHDLVGDVGGGCLRARRGGGGGGEDEGREEDREAPHVASFRSGSTFLTKNSSSTTPRLVAAIRPLRSSTTVSG